MSYISLLILALSHLVVDMYIGFLMPLLPALEISLNASFASLAGVVGLCGIIVNLIQPPAARWTKFFPAHFFLFIGPAISGALALIGIINSFELFLVFALVSVVGTGIFHPEGLIAAHVASGEHEHIGVPFFLSGGFFGFSAGAFFSSQWYTHYGFDGFWLLALPGLFFAAMLLMIRKNISPESHSESTRKRAGTAAIKGSGNFHITLLVFLGFLFVTPVAVTYTIYSKNLELIYGESFAVEWSGIILALLGLFGATGSYFWGWLTKRFSPFLLAAISQVLSVGVFLLFINMKPSAWLIPITVVLAVLWGSSLFPVIATTAKTARGLTPTERAGWIVGGSWGFAGIFQMLFGMGTEVGLELPFLVQLPVVFIIAGACLSFYMWRKSVAHYRSFDKVV